MRCFYSPSHDPYLNIALEKWLLDTHQECFYFWQNDPCCIMGRNQNAYQEIDLAYAKNHGIAIVRRFSGGGTVYQDLGNINFSSISKTNDVSPILNDIKEYLPLPLMQTGRNDLEYQGKKVSGMAYYEEDGYHLIHGTLLVDVDLNHLSKVLHPSPLKLKSHAIASVNARVQNLHAIDPSLTPHELFQKFISNAQCLTIPSVVKTQAAMLKREDWIYGNCPQFEITHEIKMLDGIYQVHLKVCDGYIEDVKLYTDAIIRPNLEALNAFWMHRFYDQTSFEKQFIDSFKHIKSDC